MKITCSNDLCLFLVNIFNMFKLLRSRRRVVLILVSWKEEPQSYTVVANIRVRTFIIHNSEGLQQLLRKTYYRKWFRRTRIHIEINQILNWFAWLWYTNVGWRDLNSSRKTSLLESRNWNRKLIPTRKGCIRCMFDAEPLSSLTLVLPRGGGHFDPLWFFPGSTKRQKDYAKSF